MTRWQRFIRYINSPITLRRKPEVVKKVPVILLIDDEDGCIMSSFVEGGEEIGGYAIRITDFPLNQGIAVMDLQAKDINWKEFPLWRKEQFAKGIVNLEWEQIKGYLV